MGAVDSGGPRGAPPAAGSGPEDWRDLLAPRYRVRLERSVSIPMRDGVVLAADLFFPEGAPGETFPVVMDYYPYRKNDGDWSGRSDHRYLAERGFVTCRLDVRGTGDSEGVAEDEYSEAELDDGCQAIAWLAAQPWCNRKVGMWGASYGGFNSLQIAMRRPPALKAICPMMFTDRRYTDDCHYAGGALEMLYDIGGYGLTMVCRNVMPPRPDLVGERWAAIWEERLARNEPWVLRWLEHQTEDAQWRHGSLCEDYASVQCATYMFGGWRDGYINACLRSYEHLRCPKKLLIGPWLHSTPGGGVPGPRADHSLEMLRFFGYWLKDIDTGIMDEPPIAVYVQRFDPPVPSRRQTSGTWRSEAEWPLARGTQRTLYLGAGSLDDHPGAAPSADVLEYRIAVENVSERFSAGIPHLMPGDQRDVEAYAAVYTSRPLEAPLEILGHPQAILHVDSSAAVIAFVVRLCDVAPDGQSALVTKGILNATHRESHRQPSPLEPRRQYELHIELNATSWVFAPGHRIRVSISNADFPNIWPTPQRATSHLHRGQHTPSHLVLPVVGSVDASTPQPAPNIITSPYPDYNPHADPEYGRATRDLKLGELSATIGANREWRVDQRYIHRREQESTATVSQSDPAKASVRGRVAFRLGWPTQVIEVESRATMESDATTFHVIIDTNLTLDGMPHFSRRWMRSIRRQLL